jgi:NAD(P)-dependent dehydrogenase (short-subunit alcohol dehydrogenase family)
MAQVGPAVAGRDFAGRNVVVTGCASGIGEQVAVVLAERGAEVIGLDRNPISTAVDERHEVDLSDSASIAAVAAAIADPIDALINVAGVSGMLGGDLVVGINFVGTRELTAALQPRMAAGAAIVNTSSTAASRYLERRELVAELLATEDREAAMRWCREHPDEVGTGYAISKDAIVWWTLGSAVGLAGRGIRINCVAPGVTETPIIEDTIRSRGEDFLKAIPMPLGRMATPREQAEVLVFLASPAASYVSGQVIWSDGGYMAGVAVGQLEQVTGSVGPSR